VTIESLLEHIVAVLIAIREANADGDHGYVAQLAADLEAEVAAFVAEWEEAA
jgi:hypothetical protein